MGVPGSPDFGDSYVYKGHLKGRRRRLLPSIETHATFFTSCAQRLLLINLHLKLSQLLRLVDATFLCVPAVCHHNSFGKPTRNQCSCSVGVADTNFTRCLNYVQTDMCSPPRTVHGCCYRSILSIGLDARLYGLSGQTLAPKSCRY